MSTETFALWWPTATLPTEYDDMDACDQAQWKAVAEAAWRASAAAEREACAAICDEQAKEPECPERAKYCAEAIRSAAND